MIYKMIVNDTLETSYLDFNNKLGNDKDKEDYSKYQINNNKKITINPVFTHVLPNGYTVYIEKHI